MNVYITASRELEKGRFGEKGPHPWLRIFDSRVLLTIPYFYLMFYLTSLILELFTKFCVQWSEFKGAWLVGLICTGFRIVVGFDHFAVTVWSLLIPEVHDRSLDMG